MNFLAYSGMVARYVISDTDPCPKEQSVVPLRRWADRYDLGAAAVHLSSISIDGGTILVPLYNIGRG